MLTEFADFFRPVYSAHTVYMAASLQEVEALVAALAPTDQIRLLQYLAPRLADAMLADKACHGDSDTAWQEFSMVGRRLAATPNGESRTQVISDMRR